MRRSLALLSEGMLSSSTKKAITIASIGWLVFSGRVPSYPSEGGIGVGNENISFLEQRNINKRLEEQILMEDEEILIVIKSFLRCQN